MTEVGLPAVLMEARQVKGALTAMPIKTDRRDAEGMARLRHLGWFRPVHGKPVSEPEVRAALAAGTSIQNGVIALEMPLRLLLRSFGLKAGAISRGRCEARIREPADGSTMLEAASEPVLRVRAALRLERAGLEKRVRQVACEDPVCLRLMAMPGLGAVVALTSRSAVDDPSRFDSSKNVGPLGGLTPSRSQSGERDVPSGIPKAGDVSLRRALCRAAMVMLNRGRGNALRIWAARVARSRGRKRVMVALARRMAVVITGCGSMERASGWRLRHPSPDPTVLPASQLALEVLKERASRDAGVWTVASHAEHAHEMDTPDLRRASICRQPSRLTADRSTVPKSLNQEARCGSQIDHPPAGSDLVVEIT